jgi:hypothetical protein
MTALSYEPSLQRREEVRYARIQNEIGEARAHRDDVFMYDAFPSFESMIGLELERLSLSLHDHLSRPAFLLIHSIYSTRATNSAH